MVSNMPYGNKLYLPASFPPSQSQQFDMTGSRAFNQTNTPTISFSQPQVYQTRPYGIPTQGIQRYLPIAPKRPLTEAEQQEIRKGLNRWWPKIGAGYITPIPQLLASPFKSSLLTGGLGGSLTSLFALTEKKMLPHLGVLGLLIGGGLCGIGNYIWRERENENIIDLMHRLPVSATKRDMLSDPAYQEDLKRAAMTGEGFQKNLTTAMEILQVISDAVGKSND
jgi:hypothetical protein